MAREVPLFDDFSPYYDLFVNWPNRLVNELPFIVDRLRQVGARRIVDAACGTGQHGIALARAGYQVTCAEPAAGMLRQAARNAAEAQVAIEPVPAGFSELHTALGGQFDAVLCLGNSLVHALTYQALVEALADFVAVLRPGGILIAQTRNYDRVLRERQRFMPLEAAEADGREYLFFRFLDFGEDLLTFNMVTMIKEGGVWRYEVGSTLHRPLTMVEADAALGEAGFRQWDFYGDYQGHPFEAEESADLILVAKR